MLAHEPATWTKLDQSVFQDTAPPARTAACQPSVRMVRHDGSSASLDDLVADEVF